jgi:dolichol-phosphate mannosyltransferase
VGVIHTILKILVFPSPLDNPAILILVLFIGGIQLISIGILGEYMGRIYDEVKWRPHFIVESSHGFASSRVPIVERPEQPREGVSDSRQD